MKTNRPTTGLIAAGSLLAVTFAPGAAAKPEFPAQPSSQQELDAEQHRPGKHPDRIVATLAGDPSSTRAVSWRTDDTVAASEAQIAEATDWTEFEAQAETVGATTAPLEADLGYTAHFHTVNFEGLQPDTSYLYRVGDPVQDSWSEWIEFTTAADTDEPFEFIFLGDAQNDIEEHWTRVVERAYQHSTDIDLMVHPGDLVDFGDRDHEWGEWTQAVARNGAQVPTLAAPGNHEYFREDGSRELSDYWRAQFANPDNGPTGHEDYDNTVYSVDHQGVRFISLNSAYREAEPGDPAAQQQFLDGQADWLEDQLSDNPNDWTVVFFHHPTYSTGEGRDNSLSRNTWRPLLEENDVDLVLSGHDHTYGRGFTNPDGKRRPLIDGPVYVNSVSGPKMYEVSGDNWTDNGAEVRKLGQNVQLYQHVSVDGDTLTFDTYTATGDRFDGFQLIKRGSGGTRLVETMD